MAIIPALDEEASIASVVGGLRFRGVQTIIVADNGSRDRTASVAREAGARVVGAPGRGYGSACLAALACVPGDARAVVFCDADGADDLDRIESVVGPVLDGAADLVVGSRTLGVAREGALTWPQRAGNRVATKLMSMLFGVSVTDLGPFRCVSTAALSRLAMRERTFGWTAEMQTKAFRIGLRVLEVPVSARVRIAGKSKISGRVDGVVRAGWGIMRTIVRYGLGPIAVMLIGATIGCESRQIPTPTSLAAPAPGEDEHAAFAKVLAAVVDPEGVDYAALRRDHGALDEYRARLARTPLPANREALMAHYINAYNAWTLALVVDLLPADATRWPGWSIKDGGSALQSVWKKYDFELAGQRLTLDQLEHERLRPMGDPRIHFAINCASRSCPALASTPYRGATLETDLARAVRVFVEDPSQLRLIDGRLHVNPILDWFGGDFARQGGVRAFLRDHVASGPVKDYLRGTGPIEFFDYDWSLNLKPRSR